MNIVGILGSALALVENLYAIALGRFILGFGFLGMSIVLSPKYIEETAPLEYKGSLGALTQIMIIVGAFLVSLLGYGAPTDSKDFEDNEYWRLMFAV